MAGKTKKKTKERERADVQQQTDEGIGPEDGRYAEDEVAIEKVPPLETVTGEGNDADDMVELSITDPGNPVRDDRVSLYTEDKGIQEEFEERQQLNAGSQELLEKLEEHNALSPNISADDVDAAWEDGNQAGEETVGGSSPTPDQDIVDDLGEAAGLTYEDTEELNFNKVYKRDVDRWELNPESAVELEEDLEGVTEDEENNTNRWSDFLDRNVAEPRDLQGFRIVDEEDELAALEDESYMEDESEDAAYESEGDLDELDDEEEDFAELGFEELDGLDEEDFNGSNFDSKEDDR